MLFCVYLSAFLCLFLPFTYFMQSFSYSKYKDFAIVAFILRIYENNDPSK